MAKPLKPKTSNPTEGAKAVPEKETAEILTPVEDTEEVVVQEEVTPVVTPEPQEDTKEEIPEVPVVPVPEVPVSVPEEKVQKKQPLERNVKVILNCDHSCNIGGNRYDFKKGKQYNVPESVKTILRQAGILMPL